MRQAGIDQPITLHKLRHTYATNLLNAGAERVDIKALLGHESIATTQIYTNVGQERMEQVAGQKNKTWPKISGSSWCVKDSTFRLIIIVVDISQNETGNGSL